MAYYTLSPKLPNPKPIVHYITTEEEELGHAYYRIQLMYDVDEVKIVEITEQQYEDRKRVKS